MKIVFLGTGEISLPTFRALLASEHEVVALVTQPDKSVGRRSQLRPPEIKVIAQEAGVPVLQPEKVRAPESLAELKAFDAEVMVVMAYGQILPQELIEMPSRAIINLHASLLPKYRGASCIQSAILNDDDETGWTVMHVVKALDAGDIIEAHPLSIREEETGESLHDRLAEAGPQALLSALGKLAKNTASRTPQLDSESCYAPKLDRENGRISWRNPASKIARQVRALHSWPGTFATFTDGKGKEKRLKIFPPIRYTNNKLENLTVGTIQTREEGEVTVICGDGVLHLNEVQPEGSKRMTAQEFLRGVPLTTLE